jgi:hypothetical protein
MIRGSVSFLLNIDGPGVRFGGRNWTDLTHCFAGEAGIQG